ncbi:MAG: N-acetyltransferase [Bacteroidaceae bacterium]|nr:N-acetyltransferase [Bacteroidaceae bacterium]
MNRIIREVRTKDMAEIMKVMDAAKQIMRQSGNMHQWGEGYPSVAVINADMEKGGDFVVEDDGMIVGYFAFLQSPEPTYQKIYGGEWIDDEQPYHVVHRIASYPEARGIFSSIMDFCFSHDANIRIDTHCDNQIMQHNILKHGFVYCGIIYLASGDERLAYQRIISKELWTTYRK